MKNSVILVVSAVLVAVLLTTSILIPVIETTQKEVKIDVDLTLTNEGTSVIKGDVSSDYTMNWDSALPGTIKINGTEITVYFVAGSDAIVSPASKIVIEDLTYGDLPTPTREGYEFEGWYDSQEYTNQILPNTIVQGSNDKILYAKWIAKEYTVSFDANGGSVSPTSKTVTFDSPYGELPTPTYTGHIFGGWFDENDNPITALSIVDIADNHTLTAAWTLEKYLVSFTTDGNGTVNVDSLMVDYGTPYTISTNTITIGSTTITATPNSGYVWDSWIPSNSGVIESATVFTANFIQPPVTLSFSAQSPGSVDIQTIPNVNIGTQYIITDNVITVVGYDTVTANLEWGYYFTGWDAPQGTGIVTEAISFNAEYEQIIVKKFVMGHASSSYTPNEWVLTTDGKLFHCKGPETSRLFVLHPFEGVVADIYTSTLTTWIITDDGKLYGYGNNQYGQQGDGTTTTVNDFTQRLSGESIKKVFAGNLITWVLTTDGKLFGCGYNDRGGQGTGSRSPYYVSTFTQRLVGEQIADMTVGEASLESAVWAITADGRLFGWGYNGNGQQGDGTTTMVTTPTQRLTDQTVSKVYSTGPSTWVITTDGKLFGCGANSSGQQGDGTKNDVLNFTQRLTDYTIKDMFMSYSTTWAITTDGKLFGCGANYNGQQGNGTVGSGTDVTSFTQRLSDITQGIECGSTSGDTTWAITTDGKLFGCGKNNSGQQGDNTTNTVKTFKQRLNSETAKEVFADPDFTWVLTTDKKIYCTGSNQYGQQGDGTTTQVKIFTQRGPAEINIPAQITNPQTLTSIVLNPSNPTNVHSPYLSSINIYESTGYRFYAGGNDWMLCTVSIGQDESALALYYAGLVSPLLWTDDIELRFSNGSMTVENNGVLYTMNYTTIYFIGDHGDYVLMTDSGYILEDTPLLGYSIPTSDSGIEVRGTSDGVMALSIASGSITVGDAEIIIENTDYDGVLSLSGLSATYNSDDVAICNTIIIPKNVSTTISVENQTLTPLLWVIPILVLVGIMVFMIRFFMNRNEF